MTRVSCEKILSFLAMEGWWLGLACTRWPR